MIYKTDHFKCMFSTAKTFDRQLQEAIERNVAEGWKLHSWQAVSLGEFCELVFYKEV